MEEHGMPPFRDVLNDRKIAAIATYIRNAWGNTYGIVTPADVAGLR
jgi:mono/diheme cytochrome c family protein